MSIFRKKKGISVEEMGRALAELTWLTFQDSVQLRGFPEAQQIIESMQNVSESQFHVELLIFLVFAAVSTCRGNVEPASRFEALEHRYRESIFEKIEDEYPEFVVSRRFETLVETREQEYSEALTEYEGPKSLEILSQLVISKMLGRNVMDMRLIALVPIWYVSFAQAVARMLKRFDLHEK